MKYSMFIGRWQPWHSGHRWLIDQRLNENKNVLICIRDMDTDKNNPFTPNEVKENIQEELIELVQAGRVKVIIIPDIESVNYGRGVGYDIIEHTPPQDIKEISATKLERNYLEKIIKETINILITGCGAPGISGTIFSLKQKNDFINIHTVGTDTNPKAVGKYFCDDFFVIPSFQDTTNYLESLLNICKKIYTYYCSTKYFRTGYFI